MSKEIKRGPNPSQLTILMLCARAAGRCQFDGCNDFLFKDEITLREFNKSNVAHIVASSPDGPRGHAVRSFELSQNIENLMLMCPAHHKLIDDNPEEFTEDCLLKMKQRHETLIAEQCSLIHKESSEILMFSSPIKGKTRADISFQQASEAIMPFRRVASLTGRKIRIEAASGYKTKEFWIEAERQLKTKFDYIVKSALEVNPNQHFSIFPIAPIPLIIELGYLMGDKIRTDVFQKMRTPDTWKWQSDEKTNSFVVEKVKLGSGNKIAMVLSLTADIAEDRVIDVFEADIIYHIRADRYGVDCIQSPLDLSEFWHKYQDVCDEIRNSYKDIKEVAVFPSIPASAAFEVGRRYMPGVYPALKIYDDNNGFFETVVIGG